MKKLPDRKSLTTLANTDFFYVNVFCVCAIPESAKNLIKNATWLKTNCLTDGIFEIGANCIIRRPQNLKKIYHLF